MCRSRGATSKRKNQKVENDDSSSEDDAFINTISTTNRDDEKNWNEEIQIERNNVNVKLDSGAQCNVIPKSIADRIGKQLNSSRTKRIITYSGHNIDVSGELVAQTDIRGKKYQLKFIVVNEDVTPVLG